jgi:hypothetical protein
LLKTNKNGDKVKRLILIMTFIALLGCDEEKRDAFTLPSNLPPDPGELGQTTFEGVDANDNQVRDDVELAFALAELSPTQRETIFSLARAFQNALQIANSPTFDKNAAREVGNEIAKLVTCLHTRAGAEARDLILILEEAIGNTATRSKAYIKFNQKISGQSFTQISRESACE